MIDDQFRLDGKAAVVTGAGRGIGAATAIGLAEAGADVVISARTPEQLDVVAATIRDRGRRAVTVAADLSDLQAVANLATVANEELGRLDIVVNNVGGAMPGPFLDTTADLLEEAFHFNVSTAHALTQAAVPLMLNSGGGSVVNISSAMGRLVERGYLAYGTAKAALAHWSRLAAADLAPHIRVNAIAVGSTATSALEIIVANPELKAAMEAATPLARLGRPEEIAAAVVYLASPAGGYVTGKVLEVDGGTERPSFSFGLPSLELNAPADSPA